jgi:hypothetical protein
VEVSGPKSAIAGFCSGLEMIHKGFWTELGPICTRSLESGEAVQSATQIGTLLLEKSLAAFDNLYLSLRVLHTTPALRDHRALRGRVDLALASALAILEKSGLTPFEPHGEAFDPRSHEAIERVERSQVAPGTVVDVTQVGFRFGATLVRPARVVVVGYPLPRYEQRAEESAAV